MPILKTRDLPSFEFWESRDISSGILIAAIAALFLIPTVNIAEAGFTRNWICTKVVGKAVHPSESLAIRNAWRKWRYGAKAKCGAQCAILKYATNKSVSSYPRGSGYGAVAKASACYYSTGFGTTKSPGIGLRAPKRLP